MAIDTAKADGRRTLNFTSLDEVLADAAGLSTGRVNLLGNWSVGQVFRHLSLAYHGSIDGITMTFPWPLRLMGKLFKKKLMGMSMPPGFTLPADGARALAPDPVSTEEGLAELRAAIERLKHEPHRAKHPMLGDLTRDQWNTIHLHHAALHMSFLVPLG